MRNIKISRTFSILIIIIVLGVFLLPNILGSISLHQYGVSEKNEIERYNLSIENRDKVLLSSLKSLNIKDKALFDCINRELSRFMGMHPQNFREQDTINLIRSLNCQNMGITDISGIELLKNLQYLDISENPITDISLILTLDNLTSFHLKNVKLSSHHDLFKLRGIKTISPPSLSSLYCEDITNWIRSNSLKVVTYLDSNFDCRGGAKYESEAVKTLAKIELGIKVSPREETLALEYKLNQQKKNYNSVYEK